MRTSYDPKAFVEAIALLAGPVILLVLLADETDEAWADLYSCAVSIQNAFPRASVRSLVAGLGAVSILVALAFDVTRYEGFLLLIGAVFVPLFGVLAADYFVMRRGRYDPGGAPRRERRGRRRARRPLAGALAWALGIGDLPLDLRPARAPRPGRRPGDRCVAPEPRTGGGVVSRRDAGRWRSRLGAPRLTTRAPGCLSVLAEWAVANWRLTLIEA